MSAKRATNKSSRAAMFFHKHWWKIGIIILLIGSLSYLAYNKYLDQQNVNNMKQLLADFEQLERDVEAETGEELTIEASCESVGKFSESYSCDVKLYSTNSTDTGEFIKSVRNNTTDYLSNYGCIVASEGYRLENATSDYYICAGVKINSANIEKAEEIFYKYDTSPGEPG